jgi:tetratricopeptide (TPR) repeat protein
VPVLVAMTYSYTDRADVCEELFASGIADFERFGWRGLHLGFAMLLLGHVRYRQGRLPEAEQLARDGLRLAERMGHGTPGHWYAVSVLVQVLLARGDTGQATEVAGDHGFQAPFPAAVTFPDAQSVHGELLLARGLHAEAADELAAVGRRLEARGIRNPAWCAWQANLALAEHVSAPERALTTALQAVDRAREFGARSAVGHTLRVAGEVAAGQERLRLLEEAVTYLDASPAAYELAHALVAHGAALRAAGRTEEAAERLERGLATARTCAADGLARRARDELAPITAARGAGA